jgi:hypothetical protein
MMLPDRLIDSTADYPAADQDRLGFDKVFRVRNPLARLTEVFAAGMDARR